MVVFLLGSKLYLSLESRYGTATKFNMVRDLVTVEVDCKRSTRMMVARVVGEWVTLSKAILDCPLAP